MNVSVTVQRRQMISELLNILAANLSSLSNDDLAALLNAASNGGESALTAKALQSPDESAMVYLNPTVTKEKAIAALNEMTGWLEEHWDEYNAAMLAEAFRSALPLTSSQDDRLLN